MKRIISVITIFAFILSMCACGNAGNTEATETTESAEPAQEAESQEPAKEAESQESDTGAEEAPGSSFTLTLYADMSGGSVTEELVSTKEISLPIENESASPSLIAFALADGLTEWTGLDFTLNDVIFNDDSVTVDWSDESTLIAGLDDREQKEEFHMYDAIGLNWFMMDSLARTIKNNLDITTVYYSSDGGPVTFTNPDEMAALGLPELRPDQPYEGTPYVSDSAVGVGPAAEWEGAYVWNESGQFTNKILRMRSLSDGTVLFEFELTEGGESEDEAEELILSGVLIVDGEGVGRYESEDCTVEVMFNVQTLSVTHNGDIAISPDGAYTFVEDWPEFSAVSTVTILENLPAAATSLNHNNGEYIISYSDETDADGFYSAEAVFADSGAVIAKFLVAGNMHAVYRVDDDTTPVQIFPME